MKERMQLMKKIAPLNPLFNGRIGESLVYFFT